MKNEVAAVILAAGEGKRMKSALPKVLHSLCGKPMFEYPLKLLDELGIKRRIVVIGHRGEMLNELLDGRENLVEQVEQLGTGHAVQQAEPFFNDFEGDILVLSGDVPLLRKETVEELIRLHQEKGSAATVLITNLPEPAGYGRIVRQGEDSLKEIVEERDASEEQKAIKEINTGTYIFNCQKLFPNLNRLDCQNDQGEYYLTDIIGILKSDGELIAVQKTDDFQEVLGINSREQLSEVLKIMREKINKRHMENGVTIIDPKVTYIDEEVKIARDTVIQPLTFIKGKTNIGQACQLGPNLTIEDSELGDGVQATYGVIRNSKVGNRVSLGPFFSLRPGTVIEDDAHIGTSVEIKKSYVGQSSKIPHLSYIGDAEIGSEVNIGAGSITCNYDGVKKHKTIIKDGAFIGSDTMFIAPVKIGKKAMTGAGSAISKDVPDENLGLERSEQRNIPDWRKKLEKKNQNNKEEE